MRHHDKPSGSKQPVCLVCGAAPTIRAHLIPQAFVREVRAGDTKIALTKGSSADFRASQNGLFDDSILCRDCDNALGRNEKFGFEVLGEARRLTKGKINTHVSMEPVSGDRLIRFASGICWKYCVTRKEFGRIDVGPYADQLQHVAFGDDPIPPSLDMFMLRLNGGGYEKHFFRAPKPDRQKGVNLVRLSLGGFVMFLKIDNRPSPNITLPEIWMRERNEVVFGIMPFNLFEEGKIVISNGKNARLKRFLESAAPQRTPVIQIKPPR